ncbi:hypothetical protein [Anatilimnocola floriformis]|uniref:hypothetical protein n=1 Tax=Anatilimnocola floriformis TaxID=2948575 RepID=UPI0020C3EF12|nr:hypothetical protein [Anatilimnocola floriformis]
MVRRIIKLLLPVAFIVGACFFCQSSFRRSQLAKEHAQLTRQLGTFDRTSNDKIYLRAVDTGEPLHFAWRMFLPANYQFGMQTKVIGPGGGISSADQEFILRYRLYEQGEKWFVYSEIFDFRHGGSIEVKSPELLEFLSQRPEKIRELRVDQFARDETKTLGPQEAVDLLKLWIPSDKPMPVGTEKLVEWIRLGPANVSNAPLPSLPQ